MILKYLMKTVTNSILIMKVIGDQTSPPTGAMLGIWKDYARFESSYLSQYKGYYFSGDGAIQDEDGYIFITGRVDDD